MVLAEVGRRSLNLHLWYELVGENLSFLLVGNNGNEPKRPKKKPAKAAVAKIDLPAEAAAEQPDEQTVAELIQLVHESAALDPEEARLLEDDAELRSEPDSAQDEQIALVVGSTEGGDFPVKIIDRPAQTTNASSENEQYEILPDMWVWPDIIHKMAFAHWQERTECPVCRLPKQPHHWLSDGCRFTFGEEGSFAIKKEVAKLRPGGEVARQLRFALHPRDKEAVIKIMETVFFANLQSKHHQDPKELARDVQFLPGIFKKIPRPILLKIAKDIIEPRVLAYKEGNCIKTVRAFLAESDLWDVDEIVSILLPKWEKHFHKGMLIWAVKKVLREKGLPKEGVTEIRKEAEVSAVTVPEGMKNLREDQTIAEAFCAFLLNAHADWKKRQKAAGRKTTAKRFLDKISYNVASWHYLRKDPTDKGISVKKARTIAQKLQVSLEKALAIGQELLGEAN